MQIRHLALVSLLSVPGAISADVFDSFFHDMYSVMRQQHERMARMFDQFDHMAKDKEAVDERQSKLHAMKINFATEQDGCRITMQGVSQGTISAEYQDDMLLATVDGVILKVQARANRLFVEAREKQSVEKEENNNTYVHYARQSQSQMYSVDRDLDIEAVEPIYDSANKKFELFIPYKKGKKISVKFVT